MTDNEAPLAKEDVQKLLSVVGDRAVLVGGQAVAWWAEFYSRQGRLRSVQRPTDLYVSIDADFVPGSLDDIRSFIADVAAQLRGTGTHKFPFTSLLVGCVAYQDSQGCHRSVEFLKTLYGIKQRDVLDGAIPFEAEDLPRIYVVAPIFLTESRVANLIDLPAYQNQRGILQARVAAEVLVEWHEDKLNEGWQNARASIERTLKLAESKAGIKAAARFDVDILGAIPATHAALPKAFREQRYRRCKGTVARAIAADRASSRGDTDE